MANAYTAEQKINSVVVPLGKMFPITAPIFAIVEVIKGIVSQIASSIGGAQGQAVADHLADSVLMQGKFIKALGVDLWEKGTKFGGLETWAIIGPVLESKGGLSTSSSAYLRSGWKWFQYWGNPVWAVNYKNAYDKALAAEQNPGWAGSLPSPGGGSGLLLAGALVLGYLVLRPRRAK